MNKNKLLIITTSIASLIFLITTITFGVLFGITYSKLDDDKSIDNSGISSNDFDYVETNVIDSENIIDYEISEMNLTNRSIFDFYQSGMRILSTEYGNSGGVSNTFINPFNNKISNLNNNSLITPYYDDSNELEMFVSGTNETEDGTTNIKHWGKENSTITNQTNSYDHEIFRYKDKDYILNGSNILISDSDNNKFSFKYGMGLGMPLLNSNGHMVSGSSTHFNSFDIYGNNLVLNSRDLGTIFSFKILNDDGTLRDESDFELNWILPGNPLVPYYLEADSDGDNPVIWNDDYDSSEGIKYHQYVDNIDYDPHFISEWEGNTLSIEIDGDTYNLEEKEDAKTLNSLSNDNKFWGEHTVRVINTFLDSLSEKPAGYDENKLYISIHDNHFPSEGVYYNNNSLTEKPEGSSDVAWGWDAYSYHDDQESTKEMFGDNPYNPEEDLKSFTKIYEIDEENKIAKLVLNVNNSVEESDIDQFSDYRSSSTFFSINGNPYLITESSMNSSFALWQFDSIDFESKTLINPINLMDIQWTGEAGGYMHYRTYPIFKDLKNSVYGWNALNKNPYNG